MKPNYFTTSQMQALERHAVEKYSISLEEMMQNAGKAVFDVVTNEILTQIHPSASDTGKPRNPEPSANMTGKPRPSEGGIGQSRLVRVLIVCGKGNNGGDALVTARLLHEKGIDVSVFNLYPVDEMSEMSKGEMEKVKKLKIETVEKIDNNYSLIIDGIFGFSLKGNPRLPEARIIEQINCSHIPVVSVDVPSGLDAHDGSVGNPTIKADYTVALGMLKKGFAEHLETVGKLYLGDLGIPEQVYRDMGYMAPSFRGKNYQIIR